MSLMERFVAYAAAFEETVVDDDWSRLDPFFTEDAVYTVDSEEPFNARVEGRAKVFDFLRESLNAMDRRFDTRSLALRGEPVVGDDSVEFAWTATYGKAGAPDFALEGTERLTYEGDRIALLEDVFEPGSGPAVTAHLEKYFG